jgi:hypothetical protein
VSTFETLAINVSHDKAQNVWFVLSSDISGLHAEAKTLEELVAVISDIAPDLIAANMPGTSADTAFRIQPMVNTKPAHAT